MEIKGRFIPIKPYEWRLTTKPIVPMGTNFNRLVISGVYDKGPFNFLGYSLNIIYIYIIIIIYTYYIWYIYIYYVWYILHIIYITYNIYIYRLIMYVKNLPVTHLVILLEWSIFYFLDRHPMALGPWLVSLAWEKATSRLILGQLRYPMV